MVATGASAWLGGWLVAGLLEYDYLTAGDVLRFGLVMTVVAMATGLFVALPYWAWLGQPLAYSR